jgi:long-chain fatty acid transport protein
MKQLSAAIALSLLPATAHAGAFYLQEQSPLGLGRAFAGEAAAATDASTVFFNPAGMAFLTRSSATAGVHALFVTSAQADRGTTRTVPGLGTPIPTGGGNGGNPFEELVPVPSAYGAFRLNDGPLWFGIGVSAPFGLKVVYDDGWFGRYDSIKSELKTINIQPSIAYRLSDRFSVGAGFDIQTIEADLTNALPNVSPLLPDGLLRVKGDDLSFGWNAGVMSDLGTVRIGAHYRSRVKHKLGGRLTISGLLGPLATANSTRFARAPITTPDIATLSAVVGADRPLRFLASANWYNWSLFDRIEVRPVGGAPTISEQNYKDSWGVHGAVEYDLSPSLTVRAGTAHDRTPTRDAFRTTRVPDGDRTWATAGATWKWRGIEANLSYAHVFVTKENIDRSDPLFVGTPALTTIRTVSRNSGDVDVVALSVGTRF